MASVDWTNYPANNPISEMFAPLFLPELHSEFTAYAVESTSQPKHVFLASTGSGTSLWSCGTGTPASLVFINTPTWNLTTKGPEVVIANTGDKHLQIANADFIPGTGNSFSAMIVVKGKDYSGGTTNRGFLCMCDKVAGQEVPDVPGASTGPTKGWGIYYDVTANNVFAWVDNKGNHAQCDSIPPGEYGGYLIRYDATNHILYATTIMSAGVNTRSVSYTATSLGTTTNMSLLRIGADCGTVAGNHVADLTIDTAFVMFAYWDSLIPDAFIGDITDNPNDVPSLASSPFGMVRPPRGTSTAYYFINPIDRNKWALYTPTGHNPGNWQEATNSKAIYSCHGTHNANDAIYSTGTVRITQGGTTVTGTGGASFPVTSGLGYTINYANAVITIAGIDYGIASRSDATHLVLDTAWVPATVTDVAYSVREDRTVAATPSYVLPGGTLDSVYTVLQKQIGDVSYADNGVSWKSVLDASTSKSAVIVPYFKFNGGFATNNPYGVGSSSTQNDKEGELALYNLRTFLDGMLTRIVPRELVCLEAFSAGAIGKYWAWRKAGTYTWYRVALFHDNGEGKALDADTLISLNGVNGPMRCENKDYAWTTAPDVPDTGLPTDLSATVGATPAAGSSSSNGGVFDYTTDAASKAIEVFWCDAVGNGYTAMIQSEIRVLAATGYAKLRLRTYSSGGPGTTGTESHDVANRFFDGGFGAVMSNGGAQVGGGMKAIRTVRI